MYQQESNENSRETERVNKMNNSQTAKKKAFKYYLNCSEITDSLHQRTCYCKEAIDIALEEQAKQLVAELRSKTFKTDLNGIDDFIFRCGYRFCCDELERLLKEKEND